MFSNSENCLSDFLGLQISQNYRVVLCFYLNREYEDNYFNSK